MKNSPITNQTQRKHLTHASGSYPNVLITPPSSAQSDLKLAGGIALIFVGIAGCIITSPFLFFGGTIGYLTGLMLKADPFDSGLSGAKIGSLGSISVLTFGLELVNSTGKSEEEFYQQVPLQKEQRNIEPDTHTVPVISESVALIRVNTQQPSTKETTLTPTEKTPLVYGALFPNPTVTKPLSGVFKTTQAINFNHQEEINEFIKSVNALVSKEEANFEQKLEESSSKISERYIDILITTTKNTLSPEQEFWDRLEQMTDKDIKSFISKLSPVKEKGAYKSSELDYLWRHFKKVEFEPSKIEQRRNKFAVMLRALSEDQ